VQEVRDFASSDRTDARSVRVYIADMASELAEMAGRLGDHDLAEHLRSAAAKAAHADGDRF